MQALLLSLGVVAGLAMSAPAYANKISADDFVRKASVANLFEIESSKLALDKSKNTKLQEFAKRMVDDHEKTGDKLQKTLGDADSKLKPEDKLDEKHQLLFNQLESASDSDFDRQYISMQTDAHKEAVSLFDSYAKDGSDPALKKFAAETLPALKAHLTHVKQLK